MIKYHWYNEPINQGMLKILCIVVLSNFTPSNSTASSDCSSLSSRYFRWLNPDGSLAVHTSDGSSNQGEATDSCCGANCREQWLSLPQSPSCQFCISKHALLCQGSDDYSVPNPMTLPSTNISLFKMSGVGLIALPPKSFTGLSINRLVIEDSNLTYISSDTFTGVKSISQLIIRNNTLDYLPQAGYLFENLRHLKSLSLGHNGLRVVSSLKSANLHKLQYLSLAGNPIYAFDVLFLQNSSLKYLDLQNVTFKVKLADLEYSGLSSLPNTLNALDLSRAEISVKAIEKMLTLLCEKNITTINLSFLKPLAHLLVALRPIKNSLQYLSLEGTDMNPVFPLNPNDRQFLISGPFVSLRELNMKNCNINSLGDGEVFKAFPNLNVLSLSANQFLFLDLSLFLNLPSLNYLDLSVNSIKDIISNVSSTASNLTVIDLSEVKFGLDQEDSISMFNIFPNLQMLSLCNAKITSDQVEALENLIHLTYLDLSGTIPNFPDMLLAYNNLFSALHSSITELYFARNEFAFLDNNHLFFSSLSSLKILDLSNNLVRELYENMFATTLEHLKLSQNLITTWYTPTINIGSHLKTADLSNNQITFVSDAMLSDFYKLKILNLSNNPIICHSKVVGTVCAEVKNKTHNLTVVNWQQYHCYDVLSNSYRIFSQPKDCDEYYEEVSTTPRELTDGQFTTDPSDSWTTERTSISVKYWEWSYVMISIILFFTVSGSIIYLKWWNIRCYIHRYFSLKKARLLQRRPQATKTKPEIQYDVFVSYSDVDRSWVLDELIPNMEADGDICLCFHERDFQVGMSILENIIDCMDRSYSLLLIVSSAFVRSKWCQFEMHLAQYRLIETFRNQLVLVLLEDIPRKARPQTLHHLMMTKTYLIWPFKEENKELFWKRLKRALKPNYNCTFDS